MNWKWNALLMATAMATTTATGCGSDNPTTTVPDAGADADAGIDAGPAKAAFSDTAIDFGGTDCGGTAPANKTFTITNSGGAPLTWSVSLDKTSVFSLVGPSSGSIDAGGTATITIAAKAVPGSAIAGDKSEASLLLTTSDPAKATTFVPLSMTAQGATFKLTPTTASFGQLPMGTQAPDIALTLTNVGTKAASVAFGTPAATDFAMVWTGSPAASTVAPLATLAGAVARFKPTSIALQNATSALTVTGAVCGDLPGPLQLSGQGTNGVVGVSPGTLDFGMVNCGTTGAAQQIAILNTGNAPFNFTAVLGQAGSSPYVISPASGTVLGGSQMQIIVTPKAVPQTSAITANLYGDTVTITTTAQNDAPHTVALKETAQGAILAATGPVAFGNKQVATSPTMPLQVTNTGNAAANVTFTGAAPFGGGAPVSVPANGNANATVTYTPDPALLGSPVSGTITLTTSDAICAPLSASVAVTGRAIDRSTVLGAGGPHTCALAASGVVYCWGYNGNGELGDGTLTAHSIPKPVPNLSNVVGISSGSNNTCAVQQAGTVKCWGYGGNGQLGNGNDSSSAVPVAVTGLTDAVAVAVGGNATCAIRTGGAVVCWGYNGNGQLGNGTTTNSNVPVAVTGLTDATSLEVQPWAAACAVRAGGGMVCWGWNGWGNLGDGTTNQSNVPVAVSGLTDATLTNGSGYYHNCALRTGGPVSCWGYNAWGNLGNGTTNQSSVPVAVSGLTDATALAFTQVSSCAVRTGGGAVCWGNNGNGQLGNGTTTQSTVPVAVSNVTSGKVISAGDTHVCLANADGTLLCWGSNWSGQLGNQAVGGNSTIPVAVIGFD